MTGNKRTIPIQGKRNGKDGLHKNLFKIIQMRIASHIATNQKEQWLLYNLTMHSCHKIRLWSLRVSISLRSKICSLKERKSLLVAIWNVLTNLTSLRLLIWKVGPEPAGWLLQSLRSDRTDLRTMDEKGLHGTGWEEGESWISETHLTQGVLCFSLQSVLMYVQVHGLVADCVLLGWQLDSTFSNLNDSMTKIVKSKWECLKKEQRNVAFLLTPSFL